MFQFCPVLTSTAATRFLPDLIEARWPASPQPLQDIAIGGGIATIVDQFSLFRGRYHDVHFHEAQSNRALLDAVLKEEGDNDCWVFSNESYVHDWKNPAWRLPKGEYVLRFTVYYEAGTAVADFLLNNAGPSRDDITLTLLPRRN